MGFLRTHVRRSGLRPTAIAALCLAALLALVPVVARADDAPDRESRIGALEGPATDPADVPATESPEDASSAAQTDDGTPVDGAEVLGLAPRAEGSDVVTLTLAEGMRDYGLAQALVDAANVLRAAAAEPVDGLVVDATLQASAIQRAAEISIWMSPTRPGDGSTSGATTELRFHGREVQPQAVAASLAGELLRADYHSIGVGCWEQQGERFYAILLSETPARTAGVVTEGAEPWSPEVQVDLSGRTSPVLQCRLQADGYRTNLSMVPESTRSIRFSWVTAPEEARLASASGLPSIAIDPECFTWTSSDEAVASVSPRGVVTMHGTSVFTPSQSREAGADVTATLEGTDRALTFHVSAAVPVYRLYHPASTAHLYTTDPNEYRSLPAHGWRGEGIKWQSVWSSDVDGERTGTPVYRLLNPTNGDHHFTVDVNEYNALPAHGWRQEGVAYYSADGPWDEELGGQPVYRIYNPYQTASYGLGSHLWTTDAGEYARLGAGGWTQEGASIYGVRS